MRLRRTCTPVPRGARLRLAQEAVCPVRHLPRVFKPFTPRKGVTFLMRGEKTRWADMSLDELNEAVAAKAREAWL